MEKDLYHISTICRKGRYNASFHLAEDSWPVSTCATPIYSQHCHLLPSHGLANREDKACMPGRPDFVRWVARENIMMFCLNLKTFK